MQKHTARSGAQHFHMAVINLKHAWCRLSIAACRQATTQHVVNRARGAPGVHLASRKEEWPQMALGAILTH